MTKNLQVIGTECFFECFSLTDITCNDKLLKMKESAKSLSKKDSTKNICKILNNRNLF